MNATEEEQTPDRPAAELALDQLNLSFLKADALLRSRLAFGFFSGMEGCCATGSWIEVEVRRKPILCTAGELHFAANVNYFLIHGTWQGMDVEHAIEEAAGRVLANEVLIGGDDDSIFVHTQNILIQASGGYTVRTELN